MAQPNTPEFLLEGTESAPVGRRRCARLRRAPQIQHADSVCRERLHGRGHRRVWRVGVLERRLAPRATVEVEGSIAAARDHHPGNRPPFPTRQKQVPRSGLGQAAPEHIEELAGTRTKTHTLSRQAVQVEEFDHGLGSCLAVDVHADTFSLRATDEVACVPGQTGHDGVGIVWECDDECRGCLEIEPRAPEADPLQLSPDIRTAEGIATHLGAGIHLCHDRAFASRQRSESLYE